MGKQDFENTQILPSGTDVVNQPNEAGVPSVASLVEAPSNVPEIGPSDSQLQTQADFSNTPILPENKNGGNIENAIDVATLGKFSPDSQRSGAPQGDIDFVNRQIDPSNGQPVPIENATNELFMPSLNKSINVGSTSGQLTGHRDIFVAQGGITPYAALERRKAAAAKQKGKLDRFKTSQPKLSKDPRFNDNILKKSSAHDEEFIARAKQEFGDGWQIALTSPQTTIGREYIQGKANLDLLAGKIDQVVDLQAEVEQAIEKGDQFVSDGTLQLHENFKTLSNEFNQEGGSLGAADLGSQLDKLNLSQNLDTYIKQEDVLTNIEGVMKKTAGIDDSNFDHFRTTTRYTEDFTEGAKAAAKEIKNNAAFRSRPDLTEDDIFQYIMNLKGKTDKRTASVSNKRAPAKGDVDPNSIEVSDQEKVINVGDQNFNIKQSVDLANNIKTKPIQFDGLVAVNSDGSLENIEGIQNVKGIAFDVMTDKNGVERKIVRGQIARTVLGPDGKEKTVWDDKVFDYDNVKAGFSNSSKGAKTFVDKFDQVSTSTPERKKKFADLAVNTEGKFSKEVQDVGRAFVKSGFKHNEFDKWLASESRAGRDHVLTDDALKQFKELKPEAFNKAKKRLTKKKAKVNEVKRTVADGRTAIFNADTKEFIRYE